MPIKQFDVLNKPATATEALKAGTPPPQTHAAAVKIKKKLPLPKNLLILFGAIFACLTALGTLYIMPSEQKKLIPIRLGLSQENRATSTPPPPTPTIDPTANWNTYANKSFSIKYPERFTVREKKPTINTQYPKIYSNIELSDTVSTITITVAKNTPQLTLANALGNGPYLRYVSTLITKPISDIKVDNTDGKMAQMINAGLEGIRADIIVIAHGKVYQMTLSPDTADAEVYALILSSMKLLNQEPADITDNWRIYADSAYKFSLRYPTNYIVEHNKVASGSPTLTAISDDSEIDFDVKKFKIDVQDIKNFGQSAVTSRQILQMPLNEYVEEKWSYNKAATDSALPDRKVGSIKQTTVDGKVAYSFLVSDKYVDDHTQELLTGTYIFVFTEYSGYKYKIWYPISDTTLTQIFNTLTFL